MRWFRILHRWFGLVSAILLMGIAITAIGLQVDLWITNTPPPGQAVQNERAMKAVPTGAELSAIVEKTAATYRAENPDTKISTITINFGGPNPNVVFGNTRNKEVPVRINGATGAVIPPPPAKFDWHYFLQDVHAGYIAGLPGRIVSVLLALSLLLLSVTGLQVYLDMFFRRRKLGRKGLFWK